MACIPSPFSSRSCASSSSPRSMRVRYVSSSLILVLFLCAGLLSTLATALSVQAATGSKRPLHGNIALRTPVTFLYHYQPTELTALDLDASHVVMTWPSLIQAAQAAKEPTTSFIIPLTNDSTTHTLSGQSRVLGPGP